MTSTKKRAAQRPTGTPPRRHVPDLTTAAALQTREADLVSISAAVVLVHADAARAELIASVLLDRAANRVDELIDRLAGFVEALIEVRCADGWNRAQLAAVLRGRGLPNLGPDPTVADALAGVLRVLAVLHSLPAREVSRPLLAQYLGEHR